LFAGEYSTKVETSCHFSSTSGICNRKILNLRLVMIFMVFKWLKNGDAVLSENLIVLIFEKRNFLLTVIAFRDFRFLPFFLSPGAVST